MHMTHNEYQYILDNYDPTIPESWGTDDGQCTAFFRLCDYFQLCTVGLDMQSENLFEQRKTMHIELEAK